MEWLRACDGENSFTITLQLLYNSSPPRLKTEGKRGQINPSHEPRTRSPLVVPLEGSKNRGATTTTTTLLRTHEKRPRARVQTHTRSTPLGLGGRRKKEKGPSRFPRGMLKWLVAAVGVVAMSSEAASATAAHRGGWAGVENPAE